MEHPCSGFYYLTELEDASCKTYLFMPMQLRNNDKIFELSGQMLDNHDNNGLLRGMIAGPMQCNAMMDFSMRMKRCM